MSPIPDSELYKIVVVNASTRVGEVAWLLEERAAGEDLAKWHVVVRLSGEGFAVLTAADLNDLFETGGEGVLDQALEEIEGLLVPSRSAEQDEVELIEARFLRDLSHGQILVVLKEGVPHGTFPARERGAAPSEPLALFDYLGEPGARGLEPPLPPPLPPPPGPQPQPQPQPRHPPPKSVEAPAVSEQRRVHAQIRHDEQKRTTFLAGADNVVRCWIGLPEPDAGAVADTPIPAVALPPQGLVLDAVMRWRDQTDHGTLHLPADRTARSSECDLHIHVPGDERFVSAEIAFLYRGRAFEVVQVEAFVAAPGAPVLPHHTVEVKVQVTQREVIELADSNEVDAVLIYGEDRTRVDGQHDQGPTALQTYHSMSGASFNLKDPDRIIDYLNEELFAAGTSLVRRRARQGRTDEVLDTEDDDVLRILRTLARHGATLYNSLGDGFEDPGRRIQLQNRDPREYSPVEFVYDRGSPTNKAKICQEGLAALETDADNCPHCPPAHLLPADLRIANDRICPFGFWSLQKIIERRDAAPVGDDAAGSQSFPLPDRRHLPPIDSVLFASSDRVPPEERDRTWQSLEARLSYAEHAPSWTEWRASLEGRVPSLLLALPHHGIDGGLDYLEVGDEQLPTEDRWLYRSQLIKEFVNPHRREPGPIVLLLGCRTDAPTDLGYVGMARRFQQLPISIVLGTLAKVLGSHAAPVAREIVDQLVSVDDPDADFGTIMRRVRRRMLARGYLMALCLVALGDAEWRLTPRS